MEEKMIQMILLLYTTAALSVLFAFFAVYLRDLLTCAIFLGTSSLFLSLTFFLLQAPDVAITEGAVGAAITTFLLVSAISNTERQE